MSELLLSDVTVTYGSRRAVFAVSLTVASGEVVAILGPSGCGKSTLLRAIAGIEPLAAGSIWLGGRDLAQVPTHRRGVGLMFQEHALFEHLDVAGNVGFGLRMQGWPRPKAQARIVEMLSLVGLSDRADARIDELSGGERQRVALARTLAPEPAVVLLDEPLGSLDQGLRREMVGMLSEAFAATAATVLYVTHDQSEAFDLADRVAVMRAGELVRIDDPGALRRDPGDDWVAKFLG